MQRVAVVAVGAALATAVLASSAGAALFFLFAPTHADAGEVVTVRLGGTPADFTLADRQKPFRDAIRIYLVPADVAAAVSSRFDPRLHFVGRIVPDHNSRGLLSFKVPPLDSGTYALAYWCPGCAPYSRGVTFGVQTIPRVSRYRRAMTLRVRLPAATESSCPISGEGAYGTSLLSTTLPPNGVLGTRVDEDGLFQKLGWLPRGEPSLPLTVRGERLDAASPPMKVLGVFWGYSYVNGVRGRGGWASAVKFPSEGCWRITGRYADVTLSYVVKVVRAL